MNLPSLRLSPVARIALGLVGLLISLLMAVDLVFGLRVPEDEEREGLDITSHGEAAYNR